MYHTHTKRQFVLPNFWHYENNQYGTTKICSYCQHFGTTKTITTKIMFVLPTFWHYENISYCQNFGTTKQIIMTLLKYVRTAKILALRKLILLLYRPAGPKKYICIRSYVEHKKMYINIIICYKLL